MNLLRSLALTAAMGLSIAPAMAHDTGSMQGMDMSSMDMKNMMGTHTMSATVTSVDTKTGIMDVTSEGMALKVHFPPTSLVNVRTGDKIMLHLGFMKQ